MEQVVVGLRKEAGEFAENKDIARDIRIQKIFPALQSGTTLVLDFSGVSGATQSFVHALIAAPVRAFPDQFYDLVLFKSCTQAVKEIVTTVSDYLDESMEG